MTSPPVSALRLSSSINIGSTPPPGTVRAKISQLNASATSLETSATSGRRFSNASGTVPPSILATTTSSSSSSTSLHSSSSTEAIPAPVRTTPLRGGPVAGANMREPPHLSDSSHLRRLSVSSHSTAQRETKVTLVVDSRLSQHLANLYKAEKNGTGLNDDASESEKLMVVMHSKNVNFKQEAIKIVIHLMTLEPNQEAIGRSVLLVELVHCLSSSQDTVRTYAAWALSNFSANEKNHQAIHDAGGISALINVLSMAASEDALKQVLSALLNISSNPRFVELIRRNGAMRLLIKLLEYSSSAADAIIPLTLMVFQNLASNENNLDSFVKCDGFPSLIKLLHHPVFKIDAMPFLVSLLTDTRRQTHFIESQGLRPLFDFVSRPPTPQEGKYDNSLEHCLIALHHLLASEDHLRMIGERNFVLPLTALLDARQDPRILVLVVEIIDAVLDADDRNGTQFVASGGIERLVSLLPARRPKRANQVIVENAILLLTGLLEINDHNQDHLLSRGVVTAVGGVLCWATNETLEHALQLVSLLASGLNGQVVYEELMQSWPHVLNRLLQMLSSGQDARAPVLESTRVKIALCFSSFLSHIESQLELVELGVVCCFIDLLSSSNQRLQFYAITALRNLSTFLAVIRREIMQEGGLEELLRLVHGPSRAAVSVARLEAMRTISNLSVTDDPGDVDLFREVSIPFLLAVLATPPPTRGDITRAVAKRKQRLSSGGQTEPNSNKITSSFVARDQKSPNERIPPGSNPSPSQQQANCGRLGVSGNPGSGLVSSRVARFGGDGDHATSTTAGGNETVSDLGSMDSGSYDTCPRVGNVGSVGSRVHGTTGSHTASPSRESGQQLEDEENDRLLEERVFQTKWENDCLIKAFTAITLHNLSLDGAFVDAVHAAGGIAVVLDHLLESTSPRLQYEAVRLFTTWATADSVRHMFQQTGGLSRLRLAFDTFKNSPVPNDSLITYTKIALNMMSIPPTEVVSDLRAPVDEDDEVIGWEPETAVLDHMKQVEQAIRTIETTTNPLKSHQSHSLPTSPKNTIKHDPYASQPVSLRQSRSLKQKSEKPYGSLAKDPMSIFARDGDIPDPSTQKGVIVQLAQPNRPQHLAPSRQQSDVTESKLNSKASDQTLLSPAYQVDNKQGISGQDAQDNDGVEAFDKKSIRKGSLRQLSKQFSTTLKMIRDQASKKANADLGDDSGTGNTNIKKKRKKKKKHNVREDDIKGDDTMRKKKKKKNREEEKEKKDRKSKRASGNKNSKQVKKSDKQAGTQSKKTRKVRKEEVAGSEGRAVYKEAWKWSVEEVGDWLDANSLGELRPIFARYRVDGKGLMGLHQAGLSRMGVLSPGLSAALLAHRRKLLIRSTSLTAPPSDSSMGSSLSLSSSRSYPNLSSSSSSSISMHGRDKIVKDARDDPSSVNGEDRPPKSKIKKKTGKRKEKKKQQHTKKKKKRAKKQPAADGNAAGSTSQENQSSATPRSRATTAAAVSSSSPRAHNIDGTTVPVLPASTKTSVLKKPAPPSQSKGKEKDECEGLDNNGKSGRRLRFGEDVPAEDDDDDEVLVRLTDLSAKREEELLMLRDVRISVLEERSSKRSLHELTTSSSASTRDASLTHTDGKPSEEATKERSSTLAAQGNSSLPVRRKSRRSRKAIEKDGTTNGGEILQRQDSGEGADAMKDAERGGSHRKGFLRSISTLFHIRARHPPPQPTSPVPSSDETPHTGPPRRESNNGSTSSEVTSSKALPEKKRGSWVRFRRRNNKDEDQDGQHKVDRRVLQSTDHKGENERKSKKGGKRQESRAFKEKNKLSRKNSSVLVRIKALGSKRGLKANQSKKTMTFSLDEDVNYYSTTDTTTHSLSRSRGDQHEEDDEDNQRGLSTPRVNIQLLGDDPGAAVEMEESSDHASYSETEEQEIADYSEVVHQTTMDSGSYPSTPKRGSAMKGVANPHLQLVSLLSARLQIIAQLSGHRKRLILELLDTEQRYVVLITVLIRQFLKPLLLLATTDTEQYLTEEEVHSIFLNASLLHSYNVIFLSLLNQRVQTWSEKQSVADLFIVVPDFLGAYGEYLHNYDAASALLRHCLQEPTLCQFVQTLATAPECEGLQLEDLLLLPYQRVIAYTHILRKLARWTWESHEDYCRILQVLKTLEDTLANNVHLRLLPSEKEETAMTTNPSSPPTTPRSRYSKLSAREGFLKLLHVNELLIGCPIDITLTPGRQYVCEAPVTLLDEITSRQKGWLYLFNDALLTTTEMDISIAPKKHSSPSLPPKESLHQDFCSFIPLEDIMTIDEAREFATIVKVTCHGGRVITIKFESAESKSVWLEHFVVIVSIHRQKAARYAAKQNYPNDDAPMNGCGLSEESEIESF